MIVVFFPSCELVDELLLHRVVAHVVLLRSRDRGTELKRHTTSTAGERREQRSGGGEESEGAVSALSDGCGVER